MIYAGVRIYCFYYKSIKKVGRGTPTNLSNYGNTFFKNTAKAGLKSMNRIIEKREALSTPL